MLFSLLQFFFNFGGNTSVSFLLPFDYISLTGIDRTTYTYPAELFPTRFRAFAHGISAASGKAGAILSALVFNTLSKKVGTPVVLWSKSCSVPSH